MLGTHDILRQNRDEFVKIASLFDQIVEKKSCSLSVQLIRITVPLSNVILESLKVHVNVDWHKICNSLRI